MTLTLHLPEGLSDWIQPRPWLRVQRGERAHLSTDGGEVGLELCKVPTGIDEVRLLELLPTGARPGSLQVVTSRYLRRSLREVLERNGVAYLDARGHVHLPWRNGVVHIGTPADEPAPAVSHLGVHGVRAVQEILDHPDQILVTNLAAAVHLSLSRAHTVLKLLETEGLVRSTGTGPATRRHVVERGHLLDWLAAQPTARRREPQLEVALYARTPEAAWRSVREHLDRAAIGHALSGSAAAAALGVGPTSVMVSTVRIAPDVPLADAARALGAEVTDRGANLRLVRDTGMVGTMRSSEHRDLRLAPHPRIYLDALGERRGDDVGQRFREVVLGY